MSSRDYDAVIVGASLAGCSTAMLLAREGAQVALVERRPDPDAFKRVCGHFIQSSAVPTLERLGLLEAMEAAGAVRSRLRMWTRWGTIEMGSDSPLPTRKHTVCTIPSPARPRPTPGYSKNVMSAPDEPFSSA